MKSVKKAFSILELFLDHPSELSLEEMTQFSGLNKATVRRFALTLVECGYLRQLRKRGKYSLGMRFLDFSGTIKMHNNVIRLAAPHLMKMRQQVNESVTLAIWDGTNTSLCQSYLGGHPLRVVPDEGTKLVLHGTSVGKAILAELPEYELSKLFGDNLKTYTHNTITNLNDLKKHLVIVNKEGVAFDDEEYSLGIRGVGSALKNGESDVVGAVGILGPSVRLTRSRLKVLAPIIKDCALEISHELGFKGSGGSNCSSPK